MNSGGASPGSLLGLSRGVERDEAKSERDGEQAAALWIAVAQQVTRAERLPLAAEAPPSAWHPSAGDMTPGPAGLAPSGGAPADAGADERMVLRVDAGTLGELEVTLDRQGGALSVVIGMENQRLVGAVLPDASALRQALEGAGLTVRSLNVVTVAEVGTVLAQRRLSPSGPKPAAADSAAQDPETVRKRKHKRLTLIG